MSHPVIVTDKLTPKTGRGLLTTKAAITWGITVGRSTKRLTSTMWVQIVCRPLPVAKQEWRYVIAEENDIGQSPNPHLQK